MGKISIDSEYSAQSSGGTPNPMLGRAMAFAAERLQRPSSALRATDQGCGKLRHLRLLGAAYRELVLVDRKSQLERTQKLFGVTTTVRRYLEKPKLGGHNLVVLTDAEFAASNLQVDIVFNLCVFDVVTVRERTRMTHAAYRNLRPGGLFALVIPRNDQSILRRCTEANRYKDGHIFRRSRITTFYSNFRDLRSLEGGLKRAGFTVCGDLSVYRQACLILER